MMNLGDAYLVVKDQLDVEAGNAVAIERCLTVGDQLGLDYPDLHAFASILGAQVVDEYTTHRCALHTCGSDDPRRCLLRLVASSLVAYGMSVAHLQKERTAALNSMLEGEADGS